MTPTILHSRHGRALALLGLLLAMLGGSPIIGSPVRGNLPAPAAREPALVAASLMASVPAPTRVTAAALDSRRALVSWKNPVGRIEAIQIWQRVHPRADFNLGENVPPTLVSAVRDALPAGAVVDFAVRVQIGGRWSELSSHVTANLPDPPLPDPVPPTVAAHRN